MHARMTFVTLGLLFIGLLLRPGPAVAVTPEMLVAEAAEEALAGTLEEGSEISVHFLSQLPGSVIGLNNFALDPRNGRFRADFITQEGMLEPAVGLAMVEVSLPVPKRRLDPGEIITAADLVVVRLPRVQVSSLALREVDALVGDYLAGMGVKALAERYGIHRATVFSHLRRRNVPSRRPGLGIDEKAEAVRLARAGVSMRAIGRRMGVDRKGVRVSLVEAGLIVDDPRERS